MRSPRRALVALILLTAFAGILTVGCKDRSDQGGVKGPPPPTIRKHLNKVGIATVTDPSTGSKRAKALDSGFLVAPGQSFEFDTDGCDLKFKSPASSGPGGDKLFSSVPQPDPKDPKKFVGTIGNTKGRYEYYATCDGSDVEGSSPPIIIVDQ